MACSQRDGWWQLITWEEVVAGSYTMACFSTRCRGANPLMDVRSMFTTRFRDANPQRDVRSMSATRHRVAAGKLIRRRLLRLEDIM
jgi:hypothetical protein